MKDRTNSRAIRKQYRSLLNTEEWRAFSEQFISDMGGSCWNCSETQHLQVHHSRYIDGLLPWEYDREDLRVLCSACHEALHNVADRIWASLIRFEPHELEIILKRIRAADSVTDLDFFDLAANRRRQSKVLTPGELLGNLLQLNQ